MANTYTKIYIHSVFAVKNRKALIQSSWEDELYKYITGIVQNKGQKMLSINGHLDHIHFLIGMKPSCCLSELIKEVKKSSTAFVNDKHFSRFQFRWQLGFGAFSYSRKEISNVINYIENQKNHHRKTEFRQEYIALLEEFNIDYKEDYLFNKILE